MSVQVLYWPIGVVDEVLGLRRHHIAVLENTAGCKECHAIRQGRCARVGDPEEDERLYWARPIVLVAEHGKRVYIGRRNIRGDVSSHVDDFAEQDHVLGFVVGKVDLDLAVGCQRSPFGETWLKHCFED